MNGQLMALKEHVNARHRLSDLIRAQKNVKMTSNLSKWIRTGVKEKEDLEEDSYKIMSQFYQERKDLLYHTADGVIACRRKDEEKYYTSITSSYYHNCTRRRCYSDRTIKWGIRG